MGRRDRNGVEGKVCESLFIIKAVTMIIKEHTDQYSIKK